MQVHVPRLVPVALLRPSPWNPKKGITKTQLTGLRASLGEYGFADVLQVAADADGTYVVLNGNSRLDELQAAGVTEVSVVELPGLAHDQPDCDKKRREFLLSFDASRKSFDKKTVLSQLQDLVAQGGDVKKLAQMTGIKNLERAIDPEATARVKEALEEAGRQANAVAATTESLVLYGPSDDIRAIRLTLGAIKGKLTDTQKVRDLLRQMATDFNLEEEAFLTILLGGLARFRETVLHASHHAAAEENACPASAT